MKRPTKLISKLKHCSNGEFQDVCDYILFLEDLTKTQRAKTIDEFVSELKKHKEFIFDGCVSIWGINEIAEQMKEQK